MSLTICKTRLQQLLSLLWIELFVNVCKIFNKFVKLSQLNSESFTWILPKSWLPLVWLNHHISYIYIITDCTQSIFNLELKRRITNTIQEQGASQGMEHKARAARGIQAQKHYKELGIDPSQGFFCQSWSRMYHRAKIQNPAHRTPIFVDKRNI